MSGHTPGPWKAITSGQSGRAAAAFYIRGGVKSRSPMVAHVKNSPTTPVAENARLIAAAPDLLEALQNMVSAWGSGFDDGESPSLDRARAAIRKAAGE